MENITKDPAYNAVDPDDFPAMLEVDRYGERSTAFDKIISATHDHFWDPLDKKYIDFSEKFDIENEYIVDPQLERRPSNTAIGDKLDEKQKIKLVNLDTLWTLLLHPAWRAGRAVALRLALPHPSRSGRTGIRRQPDARRSPPRHRLFEITSMRAGASRCRSARHSATSSTNSFPRRSSGRRLVGMQMLIEGLAMGAFATFYQ